VAGAIVCTPGPLRAQAEVEQLQRDCDAGNAEACDDLGDKYFRGFGVARDESLAARLFERACELGNADGCDGLAYCYRSGRGVPKDDTRATSFYQKACDGGRENSCLVLATAYERGDGVPQDYTIADSLYEHLCDAGNGRGCERGANLHTQGAVLEDLTRWTSFMLKDCDLRHGDICLKLGLMYDIGMWVPKDTARANELFKKGCIFGNEEACGLAR
jgi:TPR repeat protein